MSYYARLFTEPLAYRMVTLLLTAVKIEPVPASCNGMSPVPYIKCLILVKGVFDAMLVTYLVLL